MTSSLLSLIMDIGMVKNSNLKLIEQGLGSTYHYAYMDANVLFIREAKDHPVLAQVICPIEDPTQILVSTAVDYENSPAIAHFIFDLFHVTSFVLAEPFYESNYSDTISYGHNAYENVELENNAGLLAQMVPHNEQPI